MIPHHELEQDWLADGRREVFLRTLTFTEQGLCLGAQTVIAKSARDSWNRPCLEIDDHEDRILALLSVAHWQPVAPKVIDNLRNAARAWTKGNIAQAYILLAYARLPELPHGQQAPCRLFMADRLLKAGMGEAELLKGLDLLPPNSNFTKASPDDEKHPGWPKGAANRQGGKFRPKQSNSSAYELAPERLARANANLEKFKATAGANIDTLSEEEKIDMLKALRTQGIPAGWPSNLTCDLLTRFPSDRGFSKINAQRLGAIADALEGMPSLEEAKKSWATMPDADKRAFLQDLTNRIAAASGTGPVHVAFSTDIGEGTAAAYDQKTNTLIYNPNSEGYNNWFVDGNPAIVMATTHEMTHVWQTQLALGYQNGSITPENPIYRQAQIYALNSRLYIDSPKQGYEEQPVERDAYNSGNAIGAQFGPGHIPSPRH